MTELPRLTIAVEFELTRGELALILADDYLGELEFPGTREELLKQARDQLWVNGASGGPHHENPEAFTIALKTVNDLFPELRP